MSISPTYRIKCLFAGEASVGKSSIMRLLVQEYYDPNIEPTIGMSFAAKTVNLPEKNQIIKIHAWDAAGSMRFRSIVKSYMRDLDIVFLVFDMNNRSTWEALKTWKREIDECKKYETLPLFVIIGNKSDLHKYEITDDEIQKLCKDWDAKRYVISCVENNSLGMIKRIFHQSVQKYHEHILDLQKYQKELPEHVTVKYCSKKKNTVELDVDGEKSNLCCFQ